MIMIYLTITLDQKPVKVTWRSRSLQFALHKKAKLPHARLCQQVIIMMTMVMMVKKMKMAMMMMRMM